MLPSKPVTHIQRLVTIYLCCLTKICQESIFPHTCLFNPDDLLNTYGTRGVFGPLYQNLFTPKELLTLILNSFIDMFGVFFPDCAAQKYAVFLPLGGTNVPYFCCIFNLSLPA